jgi:GntR family transcriptional regulator of vanillate catabolism
MTQDLAADFRPARALPKPTRIMDHVADQLTEMIVEGTLAPGTLIRQDAVSKQLGISRTPMREALQRLEVEGLVTVGASGAARVAKYEMDEALELMEVREMVDGLAARVLARRGLSDGDASRLVDLVEQMVRSAKSDNKHSFLSQNARFHVAIIEAADHKGVQLNLPIVRITSQAVYLNHGHQPGRHELAAAEHRLILEAIASGDEESAERLAREHIRNAADFWLRRFERAIDHRGAPVHDEVTSA